jgi:hypothetical protein
MAIDTALERNGTTPSRRVGLAAWSQLLSANCRLLSQSHPDLISALSVTAQLGDAAGMPGLVRSVGERLTAEYDLHLTLDVQGQSATACLRRREPRPDGAAPAPAPAADRPVHSLGNDDDPLGLAYLPEGGYVPEGSVTVWTLALAVGCLALMVVGIVALHLAPFAVPT